MSGLDLEAIMARLLVPTTLLQVVRNDTAALIEEVERLTKAQDDAFNRGSRAATKWAGEQRVHMTAVVEAAREVHADPAAFDGVPGNALVRMFGALDALHALDAGEGEVSDDI